jgi:hypothetical protein
MFFLNNDGVHEDKISNDMKNRARKQAGIIRD